MSDGLGQTVWAKETASTRAWQPQCPTDFPSPSEHWARRSWGFPDSPCWGVPNSRPVISTLLAWLEACWHRWDRFCHCVRKP